MKYTDRELEDILNKLIASTRSPRGRFSAASSYPQLEKKLNFRNSRLYLTRTFAAAAAVVLLCLSVWTAYLYMQPATIQTVSTLAETRTVHLPDGTSVTLNHYSSLSYPERFKSDNREVELSGEAYFEVTRNEEIPFKVHTEELDVKVLGTKFNFRNYKDDLEAKVCLLEGKVALNTREKETILHPDQQALLDKKTGKLSVSDTKAAYSAEWTNDFLYFDEVLLSDIIKELERSYDVKITVADDTLNTIRFYGNFRKREQSIREIMNVLSSTDKMTYTVNGKNIVITLPE